LILVPVESDLQEIVKEISIMKQCDSPYIVRYFGSYFKDADLWVKEIHQKSILFIYFLKIVMEYCGAGSVSDIMKLRGKTVNRTIEIYLIFSYSIDLVKRTRNRCYIKIYTQRIRIFTFMQ